VKLDFLETSYRYTQKMYILHNKFRRDYRTILCRWDIVHKFRSWMSISVPECCWIDWMTHETNIDDLSSRYNLSDIIERTCTIYDNGRFCNLPACVKCVKIMFARLSYI